MKLFHSQKPLHEMSEDDYMQFADSWWKLEQSRMEPGQPSIKPPTKRKAESDTNQCTDSDPSEESTASPGMANNIQNCIRSAQTRNATSGTEPPLELPNYDSDVPILEWANEKVRKRYKKNPQYNSFTSKSFKPNTNAPVAIRDAHIDHPQNPQQPLDRSQSNATSASQAKTLNPTITNEQTDGRHQNLPNDSQKAAASKPYTIKRRLPAFFTHRTQIFNMELPQETPAETDNVETLYADQSIRLLHVMTTHMPTPHPCVLKTPTLEEQNNRTHPPIELTRSKACNKRTSPSYSELTGRSQNT
jgi:hypothetical protein